MEITPFIIVNKRIEKIGNNIGENSEKTPKKP